MTEAGARTFVRDHYGPAGSIRKQWITRTSASGILTWAIQYEFGIQETIKAMTDEHGVNYDCTIRRDPSDPRPWTGFGVPWQWKSLGIGTSWDKAMMNIGK